MSDTEDTEVRVAAAEGAAAAVDAVVDEQTRRESEENMAVHTEIATGAAAEAAEQAQQAAEAAQMATDAAVSASQTAEQASGTAEQAAHEAAATRADVDGLRQEVTQGWQGMREYLDRKFGDKSGGTNEPTEVVVTHAAPTDTAGSDGSNSGSDGSTGDNSGAGTGDSGGATRRRHRFGNRR
jgi:hypothetical protein